MYEYTFQFERYWSVLNNSRAVSMGRVLATGKVSAGRQTLTVPPFLIDVALKVSSSPSAKK